MGPHPTGPNPPLSKAKPHTPRAMRATGMPLPMKAARSMPLLPLLLLLLAAPGAPLSFMLEPSQQRCISEQIPAKTLLTGDWELAELADATSMLEIFDPEGGRVFLKRELEGHFAVTAQRAGLHRVCVTNNATVARSVSLNTKTALVVANHETVAKKEHVEAIEAELDRMKKMAVHVYE